MDPNTKDLIDLISKLLGVLSVFVAIFLAWWQVEKTRRERKEQAARDAMQRQKELEARELQIKVTQAAFWLELRKMFAEHNDVHFNLRPGGSWYQSDTSPSSSDLPKVEAYIGLFEHCQRMIDDGLLDLATFKHIYVYRIDNLLSNSVILEKNSSSAAMDGKIFSSWSRASTGCLSEDRETMVAARGWQTVVSDAGGAAVGSDRMSRRHRMKTCSRMKAEQAVDGVVLQKFEKSQRMGLLAITRYLNEV